MSCHSHYCSVGVGPPGGETLVRSATVAQVDESALISHSILRRSVPLPFSFAWGGRTQAPLTADLYEKRINRRVSPLVESSVTIRTEFDVEPYVSFTLEAHAPLPTLALDPRVKYFLTPDACSEEERAVALAEWQRVVRRVKEAERFRQEEEERQNAPVFTEGGTQVYPSTLPAPSFLREAQSPNW